jgi:2-dehydropantoate 2-reductase
MKIAIVGAGAIGGFFAARLAEAGYDVSLLARGNALEAIRSNGLRLESEGRSISVRPRASDSAAELGVHDLVLLCVKAPALPSAVQTVAPLFGPDTAVVPALNGMPWWFFLDAKGALAGYRLRSVDPNGSLEKDVPVSRVVGCVVYPACTSIEPGHVKHTGGNRILLGEPRGEASVRARALAEVFCKSGLAGEATDDIRKEVWAKLLGNLCFNPVSLLTGSSTDRLIDDPLIHSLFVSMMEEAIALGRKLGIDAGIEPRQRIANTRKLGYVKTSMLQDAEALRPVEIEGILGAVVEAAHAAQRPVPLLDAVYALSRKRAEVMGILP